MMSMNELTAADSAIIPVWQILVRTEGIRAKLNSQRLYPFITFVPNFFIGAKLANLNV
jgi:hypothetical protein